MPQALCLATLQKNLDAEMDQIQRDLDASWRQVHQILDETHGDLEQMQGELRDAQLCVDHFQLIFGRMRIDDELPIENVESEEEEAMGEGASEQEEVREDEAPSESSDSTSSDESNEPTKKAETIKEAEPPRKTDPSEETNSERTAEATPTPTYLTKSHLLILALASLTTQTWTQLNYQLHPIPNRPRMQLLHHPLHNLVHQRPHIPNTTSQPKFLEIMPPFISKPSNKQPDIILPKETPRPGKTNMVISSFRSPKYLGIYGCFFHGDGLS